MKTAVEAVFTGKARQYNRRFLQMCSHYLVEPPSIGLEPMAPQWTALHPGLGLGLRQWAPPVQARWRRGRSRTRSGVRERIFTPRLRVGSLDELNALLMDRCVSHARAHRHPEQTDRTIWEVFEAERPHLVPYAGPFDGFHSVPASVSKTCTVRFDNNRYSVLATAVGRPVDVHAYADRIVIRQDGAIVGEHARVFGRSQTVYDPWHYVPVLARKPGALRNGAPFKDWVLPPALGTIRRRLKGSDDGDRQMVEILTCVSEDGLAAVEAACREALDQGVHSAPVVINILIRRKDTAPPRPKPSGRSWPTPCARSSPSSAP